MNVRELAHATLDRVMRDKSYSNIAVDTVIKRENLEGKDRSLFCVLVYGVIERKITLDHLIDTLSDLPPEKIELSTRNLIRMGLYQLRFLDRVPDHAAVGETVALAPRRTRGFVNAILRNYLRQKDTLTLPKKEDGIDRALSVLYSYPEEFCQKLIEEFGAEKAETILAAFEKTPPLTLRTNTLKTSREELLKLLADKEDKGAHYTCAMALVYPDGRELTAEGYMYGTIIPDARGEHGFGYDPIFIAEGESRTVAEMTDEEKNAISHRGKALALLFEKI